MSIIRIIRIITITKFKGMNCMSINKIRSLLYGRAKILGDVNAVKKGKVGKRVTRRIAGKETGRLLGKLFKKAPPNMEGLLLWYRKHVRIFILQKSVYLYYFACPKALLYPLWCKSITNFLAFSRSVSITNL